MVVSIRISLMVSGLGHLVMCLLEEIVFDVKKPC